MNALELVDHMLVEATMNAKTPADRKRAEIVRDLTQVVIKHMNDVQMIAEHGRANERFCDVVKALAVSIGLVGAMGFVNDHEARMGLYEGILEDSEEFCAMFSKLMRSIIESAAQGGEPHAIEALNLLNAKRKTQ